MILDTFIFKKTIAIFTLIFWICSARLSTKFANEPAINLALSISTLQDNTFN